MKFLPHRALHSKVICRVLNYGPNFQIPVQQDRIDQKFLNVIKKTFGHHFRAKIKFVSEEKDLIGKIIKKNTYIDFMHENFSTQNPDVSVKATLLSLQNRLTIIETKLIQNEKEKQFIYVQRDLIQVIDRIYSYILLELHKNGEYLNYTKLSLVLSNENYEIVENIIVTAIMTILNVDRASSTEFWETLGQIKGFRNSNEHYYIPFNDALVAINEYVNLYTNDNDLKKYSRIFMNQNFDKYCTNFVRTINSHEKWNKKRIY